MRNTETDSDINPIIYKGGIIKLKINVPRNPFTGFDSLVLGIEDVPPLDYRSAEDILTFSRKVSSVFTGFALSVGYFPEAILGLGVALGSAKLLEICKTISLKK